LGIALVMPPLNIVPKKQEGCMTTIVEKMTQTQRPRDLSERSRQTTTETFHSDACQKFTLPLEAARRKALETIREQTSDRGYMTIVENWRQLADGQIEFSVRRLTTDD
jgi:hypothetical protein